MALEAKVGRTGETGVDRVVLEQYPEGVYVYVFERPDSRFPEWDHLQDDWDMAKRACAQDYGIALDVWKEIPDTSLHGPHN